MTNKCIHARKKRNLLKGYVWCNFKKKVIEGDGTNCFCRGHCKSLFVWIKELIIYGR